LNALSFVEVEPSPALNESLEAIPDRMAFKIGTAAELVGVKPYVLRFWETEFEALHPKKSRKGQRAYSRRDVETAMIIKKLLYEDRFSIEGARARLRELRSKVKEERGATTQLAEVRTTALNELRSMQTELTRFRALLV
jgi:DNA-binding transcriptional MerR regulator